MVRVTNTPADPGGAYLLQRLKDEVSDLRDQVAVLMRVLRATGQRAVVQSVPGGAMINVTVTGSSNIIAVPYLLGYSPSIGHGGYLVDWNGNGVMFFPVSAYL